MKHPSRGLLDARAVRAAYNEKHSGSILRDSDRFYRRMAGLVLDAIEPAARGRARIADVGCGGGYFLREAAARGQGIIGWLHGIEISDVALREARREAPGAALVLGQGESLPYESASFDAVVCLGNLEHFLDPALGARELARVARPAAKVWVLLPNSFYSGDIWRVVRTGFGPNHHQVIDRFATVNEWRDLLEENGLVVEGITPYNRFKWWKRLLPRNLAYHFLYRTRPAV